MRDERKEAAYARYRATRKAQREQEARKAWQAQRQWIADHGGSRAAYVLLYEDNDGGAIYQADADRLTRLGIEAGVY